MMALILSACCGPSSDARVVKVVTTSMTALCVERNTELCVWQGFVHWLSWLMLVVFMFLSMTDTFINGTEKLFV